MEMGESHEVGEDLNWKRNLIVLWCCVFLVCASYTMVIPFLPLFLLKELQLPVGVAKMWSGGIIAITCGSGDYGTFLGSKRGRYRPKEKCSAGRDWLRPLLFSIGHGFNTLTTLERPFANRYY